MLDKYIARFNGSEVQVTIGKKQRNRSESENRYYWGVVVNILADYCGYMPEEMHITSMFTEYEEEIPISKLIHRWSAKRGFD